MENNVSKNELLKEIVALKAERDALAAQVVVMREQLQIAHDCITCADETGYVQDVGYVDLEAVTLELRAVIESTPQQRLRDVKAEAVEKAIDTHTIWRFWGIEYLLKSDLKGYAASLRQGGA